MRHAGMDQGSSKLEQAPLNNAAGFLTVASTHVKSISRQHSLTLPENVER